MNRIKIIDKKLLILLKKCDWISIILCLFSLLFTYYYFKLYITSILLSSLFLFEAGLSIKIGSFISAIIIQKYL